MKIKNQKVIPFLFVFLVATPLSFVLSGVNTWRDSGFGRDFVSEWMINWLVGFSVVYPFALLFVALAKKIIHRLTL